MAGNSNTLEDVFLTQALTQGFIDRDVASQASARAELMQKSANRINQQAALIKELQAQLATVTARAEMAEQDLLRLREQNAESVAVANSAALTLRQTVEALIGKNGDSDTESNYFLRTLRTTNYHAQVEKFLASGTMKSDPRGSKLVTERGWYDVSAVPK